MIDRILTEGITFDDVLLREDISWLNPRRRFFRDRLIGHRVSQSRRFSIDSGSPRSRQIVALDSAYQNPPCDAEHLGRARLVTAAFRKGIDDLGLLERFIATRTLGRLARRRDVTARGRGAPNGGDLRRK